VRGGQSTFGKSAQPTAGEVAAARRLQPAAARALLDAALSHAAPCPVCGDAPDDPVVAGCGHVYCR
jgi:hypothetical protein